MRGNYTRPSMSDESAAGPGAARIDRWLFAVRLYKSRSLAAQAVAGGRVHLNGDRLTLMRGALEFECTVSAIPTRRGPAQAAARCYEETPASAARRAAFAERM